MSEANHKTSEYEASALPSVVMGLVATGGLIYGVYLLTTEPVYGFIVTGASLWVALKIDRTA